ncbi:MAG: glycosyltransferase family 2 protein [Thermoleophilaceae bacterium]|nr:glycosyltransferase family 2 protein [Thermoleophilaceae bacterium]
MPAIGVVIRTLDEERLIGTCLETLSRQHTSLDLDVLVVDSGSQDATIAIARSHGARVFELAPGEFDYSSSLNAGIERVAGDLVLILSAHAVPADLRWVERMAAPFADPQVAGVSARQLPWGDAPWREVLRLTRQFGGERRVFAPGGGEQPLFSNAASCIRRSVWRDRPFTLPAAEDLDWARGVVAAGHSIVYEPAAAVHHSHLESPRAQAQRLIDVNRISGGESRTRRRTLREAAGLLYRDSGSILGLDEPPRRKLSHLVELTQTVSYYVYDFSRSGTTAERRRARSG